MSVLIIYLMLALFLTVESGHANPFNVEYMKNIGRAHMGVSPIVEKDQKYILSEIDEYTGKAIQTLAPGTSDYYSESRYVPHVYAMAAQASVMFELRRPDLARSHYHEAIRLLYTGQQRQAARLRSHAADAQLLTGLLDLGAGLAGVSSHNNDQLLSAGLRLLATGTKLYSLQYYTEANNLNTAESHATGDFFRMPIVQGGQLQFIGQLFTPAGRCTAFQVKWRIVVTNAHCVVAKETNTIYDPDDLKIVAHIPFFYESFLSGEGITSRVEKVVLSKKYMADRHFEDDWAVLVTDKPINLSDFAAKSMRTMTINNPFMPGAFGGRYVIRGEKILDVERKQEVNYGLEVRDISGEIKKGSRIAVAGYSGDINSGNVLMMDYGCPVTNVNYRGGLYEYECSTFPGNSGGPIFAGDIGKRLGEFGRRAIRPLTVIGVNACVGKDIATGLVDLKTQQVRADLSSCGVKAAKFLPTVEREYRRLPPPPI